MPEHRGDGRERHAGGDGGDTEAVVQPFGGTLGDLQCRRGARERRSGGPCSGGCCSHSHAVRPRRLVRACRTRWTSPEGVATGILGDRYGPPVVCAALKCGDPELGRLEVHVAGSDAERLAHPASSHGERAGERLHGRLGVSRAAARKRVRSSAAKYFRPQAPMTEPSEDGARVAESGRDAPECYVTPMETTITLIYPAFSGRLLLAIPPAVELRGVRKRYRLQIMDQAPGGVDQESFLAAGSGGGDDERSGSFGVAFLSGNVQGSSSRVVLRGRVGTGGEECSDGLDVTFLSGHVQGGGSRAALLPRWGWHRR